MMAISDCKVTAAELAFFTLNFTVLNKVKVKLGYIIVRCKA